VMALRSIYYLDDEIIARVLRHLARFSDTFVWQCNVKGDINRAEESTFQKASVEYAESALRENGFPRTRVIAPKGHWNPLVIGTKI